MRLIFLDNKGIIFIFIFFWILFSFFKKISISFFGLFLKWKKTEFLFFFIHLIIVSERLKREFNSEFQSLISLLILGFSFLKKKTQFFFLKAIFKCFWHQWEWIYFHSQSTHFFNSPDFPSTRYSLMDLVCTHCNCTTFNRFCIVIYCHCLSDSELGNLRTCCLPWKYSPFLRRILRNQTLIPRIRRFLVRSLPWQQDDKSEIWMKRRRASLRPRSDTVIVNHQAFLFWGAGRTSIAAVWNARPTVLVL